MAKLAPTSIKYVIKANIKAKGVIEKPDVIGAIFGQTEGLLGADMDLRELQRTGRIGRIDVNIKSEGGKSEGEIVIPSSLDSAETALIAAALETIERVGPCTAEIEVVDVEDTRSNKREYVMDRAKHILKHMVEKGAPETSEVSETIKKSIRTEEISTYHGLPCGPKISEAEDITIVEGRADVVNLLKHGVNNVVAIEGTSIPSTVVDLAKEKTVTVFVDGDRGGQLIIKEFMQKLDVDFIAVAPEGKEVEELTQKELYKALRSKVPAGQYKAVERKPARRAPARERGRRPERRAPSRGRPSRGPPRGRPSRGGPRGPPRGPRSEYRDRPPRQPRMTADQKELFKKTLKELSGSGAARIFSEDGEMLGKVPVKELPETLKTLENPHTVVFDGKITPDLTETAWRTRVKFLVGTDKEEGIRSSVATISKKDLE
jgi:5S rRNA maturation endonuclease (ribonuclease M5)